MKTYWLYRYFYTERWNRYSPTYYLGKQFQDMAQAQIIGLNDNEIPEDRYTGEVAPWIITMRRFISCSYDDTKLSEEDFAWIVSNVSSMNDIVLFDTVEEAREWIINNTNLEEVEEGKFLIYPERVDEITEETLPAEYLEIN